MQCSDITSLTDAIAGYVDEVWVPFKKIDVCQFLTPKCPLSAGTSATFVFGLTISNDYPVVMFVFVISALLYFTALVPFSD